MLPELPAKASLKGLNCSLSWIRSSAGVHIGVPFLRKTMAEIPFLDERRRRTRRVNNVSDVLRFLEGGGAATSTSRSFEANDATGRSSQKSRASTCWGDSTGGGMTDSRCLLR